MVSNIEPNPLFNVTKRAISVEPHNVLTTTRIPNTMRAQSGKYPEGKVESADAERESGMLESGWRKCIRTRLKLLRSYMSEGGVATEESPRGQVGVAGGSPLPSFTVCLHMSARVSSTVQVRWRGRKRRVT